MKKTYTRKEVEEIVKEAELAFSDFLAKSGGAAEKLTKAEEPPKEEEKKDDEKSASESTTTESTKSKEESKGPLELGEMPPQFKENAKEKEGSEEDTEEKSKEDTEEKTASETAEKMEPMASESSKSSSASDASLSTESSVSSPAVEAPPLDEMYEKMGKDELGTHYRACKKAMWKSMASTVAKSEAAPKADPRFEELQKSVAERDSTIELLRKENEDLKKTQEAAGKVISLLAKPSRKAIVSADQVVGKPGEKVEAASKAELKLSKAEVDEKLSVLARSDRLTTGEREEINKFYLERGDESGVMKIIASKQEAK